MHRIIGVVLFCGIAACNNDDAPKKHKQTTGRKAGRSIIATATGTGAATTTIYWHADEAKRRAAASVGRKLRVRGFVGMGSVRKRLAGKQTETGFDLLYRSQSVAVQYRGPLPDSFDANGGSEVVVTGAFQKRGGKLVLVATDLMTKCPSKYEGVKKR